MKTVTGARNAAHNHNHIHNEMTFSVLKRDAWIQENGHDNHKIELYYWMGIQ